MRKIVLVVDDVRSCENVGSLLRTADGLGVEKVVLCGITPYPKMDKDPRLPHIAEKLDKQITKTALGAEKSVKWHYSPDILTALEDLKDQKYEIVGLEQTDQAIRIERWQPATKTALIVGNEVSGVSKKALDLCYEHIMIPMHGKKESLNVSVATAIALFAARYF